MGGVCGIHVRHKENLYNLTEMKHAISPAFHYKFSFVSLTATHFRKEMTKTCEIIPQFIYMVLIGFKYNKN